MKANSTRILAGFSEIAGQHRPADYVGTSIKTPISIVGISAYSSQRKPKTAAINHRIACEASRITARSYPARFKSQSWRSTGCSTPTVSAAAGGREVAA